MDVDDFFFSRHFDMLGQEYLDLVMGDNADLWSAGLDHPRHGLGLDGHYDHQTHYSNDYPTPTKQETSEQFDHQAYPSENPPKPTTQETPGHIDYQFRSSNNSPTSTKQKTPGPDATRSIFGPFHNSVTQTIDLTQDISEYQADSALQDESRLRSQILEIFPDISLTHVAALLREEMTNFSHENKSTLKARVIERILGKPSYPKQQKHKKEAPEASSVQDDTRWEREQHHDSTYISTAREILMRTFPFVPLPYVRHTMQRGKSLFSVYVELSSFERSTTSRNRPYTRLVRKRRVDDHANDLLKGVWVSPAIADSFLKELQAAQNRSGRDADAFRKREEEEIAERRNEEEHTRAKNLVECQCCYLDVPLNRAIHCEGTTIHFFCFGCIRKNGETQIGLMKYQLQCIDTSGCQAEFARSTLEDILGPSLTKKLDSLQQEDEVRRAGLEGLDSCPFCEFKAVCAPIEEDREFRCQNPACEEVSCRLCRTKSHIPQTCAEAAKEKGIPERRQVEEAMSEALIRQCPHCKVNIVKESGCNKMICSKCSHVMCYICRQDITHAQYNHFGQGLGSCPTHDPVDNADEQAVKQAEKRTIDKLIADNPNLTREELFVHRHKQSKVDLPPRARHGLHHVVADEPPQPFGGGLFRPWLDDNMWGPQFNAPSLFEQPNPHPRAEPLQRQIRHPGPQGPRLFHNVNKLDPLAGLPMTNLAPSMEPLRPRPSFGRPSRNPPAVPNHNNLFALPPYAAHPPTQGALIPAPARDTAQRPAVHLPAAPTRRPCRVPHRRSTAGLTL